MPHSKTPGGQAPSNKFQKQQAEAKGLGSNNASGHTKGNIPGDAPVAGDSYTSTVGTKDATNTTGEKGNVGAIVGEMGSNSVNSGNSK